MRYATIIKSEFRHFVRSPFKVISLVLFIGASIYGLQSGYDLYNKYNKELATISEADKETAQKGLDLYDKKEEGGRADMTQPMWALYYTPSTAVKRPSPLMPFSIGQTQEYGYYMKVTEWSNAFDQDLSEELANPEHIAFGTLDFSFVVLYLMPVLIIILLFNIGGLEKDLGFQKLVEINSMSSSQWLMARFTFYVLLLLLALLLVMLPYAMLTDSLKGNLSGFFTIYLYILVYALIWFVAFYFINLKGKGSSNQALKMVSLWLLVCVVLPGAVHQVASLKYPANYMTEYLDASRDETYDIWYLPQDSIRLKLLELHPELQERTPQNDTIQDSLKIEYPDSPLVNHLMKTTSATVENKLEEKNQFIKSTYIVNPIGFFQNRLNALTSSDYYAYKQFRENIQNFIDKKVYFRLIDTWNQKTVTKERYREYLKAFNTL